MADRRRIKQRKLAEQAKPSKEEYAIAKFLRFKIKAYDAKLHGAEVKYFIASEAVDALMSSKWAKGLGQGGILLTTRASCVSQLNNLLLKGCLFHRAEKVERKKHETKSEGKSKKSKDAEGGDKTGKAKGKDGNVSEGAKKSPKESSKGKDSKSAKLDTENKPGASKDESSSKTPEKSKKDDDKKKKQRRVRLQMHEHQAFKDGEEYYVWIYDPVSWKTFIIGLLLLLGVIAVCLFPLWPPEVRIGISYLSWIAIGLLGVIFAIFVVRLLVFVIVWGVSFGEHYFWLLPNLSEDVGFWESFVPLYDHKLASDETAKKDENSRSKDGGETNANETEGNKVEGEEASAAEKDRQAGEEETPDDKENASATGAGDRAGDNEEEEEAGDSDQGGTGSEADNNDSDDERQTRRRRRPAAARPGTGLDIDVNTDNGFEMLDPENDNVSDNSDLLGDSDDDKKDQ